MKRIAWLLVLALSGCAHHHYRFGLSVPGELSLSKAKEWKADVVEGNSGRKMKAEVIAWQFGGVLVGGKNGTFSATAPGRGVIRALFPIGEEKKSLETHLLVTGQLPTPTPVAVESPVVATFEPTPEAAPTPEPQAAPVPTDDAEGLILKAYEVAGKGDYLAALALIGGVKEPSWIPKVKVLRMEWGKPVADRLIEKAAKCLLDKDLPGALKQLEQLKGLSLTPKQQEQERLVRKRLKDSL